MLGRPAEPFSSDEQVRQAIRDPGAYFARWIDETSTPNGVYGLKVFPHQFDLIERSRWAERLPNLRFIYFQRTDLLGQALSAVRSLQTGQFESNQPIRLKPRYDRRHIAAAMQRIAHNQARWAVWFARNGIDPLRLTYEQLLADPQSTVQSIADYLEVDDPIATDPSMLTVEVQRDDLTDAWADRFLRESGDLDYLDDEFGRLRPRLRRLRAMRR